MFLVRAYIVTRISRTKHLENFPFKLTNLSSKTEDKILLTGHVFFLDKLVGLVCVVFRSGLCTR